MCQPDLLTLTFSGCTALAVLPADLLKHNTLLISAGSTFYGCAALEDFRRCLHRALSAFGATFETGVVEIPENLFSGNLLVTAYGRPSGDVKTCAQCLPDFLSPVSTPFIFTNVFAGASHWKRSGRSAEYRTATTIGYLFDGCPQLRTNVSTIQPSTLFDDCHRQPHSGCSALTGKGLVFMGKVPNVTTHYYAFYSCTSHDFADLPGNWITNKL
ncbi:MAG: hypothetical protein ACLR17_00445 [Enterobacteriaceae bacterium]